MFALTDKLARYETLTHVGGFRLSGNRYRAGLSPAHSRKGFLRLDGISRTPDDTRRPDFHGAEQVEVALTYKPAHLVSHGEPIRTGKAQRSVWLTIRAPGRRTMLQKASAQGRSRARLVLFFRAYQ